MKTRYIPQGYTQYKPEIGYPENLFACYVDLEKNIAIFYKGKSNTHVFYNRFSNTEAMKKKINETISRLMTWEDRKAQRKEERKAKVLNVKVGDLFSSSWGYEQTNVDFYQCIAVKGKTFTIREIAGRTLDETTGNSMASYVAAKKDAFLDKEPMTKRSFNLTTYSSLHPTTENEKHYCSWYA